MLFVVQMLPSRGTPLASGYIGDSQRSLCREDLRRNAWLSGIWTLDAGQPTGGTYGGAVGVGDEVEVEVSAGTTNSAFKVTTQSGGFAAPALSAYIW